MVVGGAGGRVEFGRGIEDAGGHVSGFDVATLGLTGQFTSPTEKAGLFTYGFDYYADTVDSYKLNWDSAGVFTGADIQGPVGDDAAYSIADLYVQDEITLSDMVDLSAGLRYTMASLSADKVDHPTLGQISVSDD